MILNSLNSLYIGRSNFDQLLLLFTDIWPIVLLAETILCFNLDCLGFFMILLHAFKLFIFLMWTGYLFKYILLFVRVYVEILWDKLLIFNPFHDTVLFL